MMKGLLLRLLVVTLCIFPSLQLLANGTGETVVSGSASFTRSNSTTLNVNASNGAIIGWNTFSIQSGETTTFNLPSSQSSVLNRVTGGNPSSIYGTLNSNGKVYLINPNGILVGPSGLVNTMGFVASTLDVSNSEYLAGGSLTFKGNSTATVTNLGTIRGAGGDVILIAREVYNGGNIIASGNAGLGAGSEVLVSENGNEHVLVSALSGDGKVENTGIINAAVAEIKAAGGNSYSLAINTSGIVKATVFNNSGGKIFLKANSGTSQLSGTLSAKDYGHPIDSTTAEINIISPVISSTATLESDGTTSINGGVYQSPNSNLSLGVGAVTSGGNIILGGNLLGSGNVSVGSGNPGAGGGVVINWGNFSIGGGLTLGTGTTIGTLYPAGSGLTQFGTVTVAPTLGVAANGSAFTTQNVQIISGFTVHSLPNRTSAKNQTQLAALDRSLHPTSKQFLNPVQNPLGFTPPVQNISFAPIAGVSYGSSFAPSGSLSSVSSYTVNP